MREIKFRAWSKLDNKYYYRVLVGNTSEDEDQYVCSNIYDGDEWVEFDKRCGVIEQYTGLKDKNGAEIYEGDIVEVMHNDWIKPTFHAVRWCGDSLYPTFNLVPELDTTSNSLSLVLQSDFIEIEIVGNIHENPELLEEK